MQIKFCNEKKWSKVLDIKDINDVFKGFIYDANVKEN